MVSILVLVASGCSSFLSKSSAMVSTNTKQTTKQGCKGSQYAQNSAVIKFCKLVINIFIASRCDTMVSILVLVACGCSSFLSRSSAMVSANTKQTTKQGCNGSQDAQTSAVIKFLSVLTEDHVWFEDRWMFASLCDE
jgi:FlaG/FlaF family flagellin (archaellin)